MANQFEGRAAIAAGDAGGGIERLVAAVDGFVALRTPFERARTEVDLARALRAEGRDGEADDTLAAAIATFEGLGAVVDLERARAIG